MLYESNQWLQWIYDPVPLRFAADPMVASDRFIWGPISGMVSDIRGDAVICTCMYIYIYMYLYVCKYGCMYMILDERTNDDLLCIYIYIQNTLVTLEFTFFQWSVWLILKCYPIQIWFLVGYVKWCEMGSINLQLGGLEVPESKPAWCNIDGVFYLETLNTIKHH